MKIVWETPPAPTGRFKSFQGRSWPRAFFGAKDGPCAAALYAMKSNNYRGCYARMEDVGFDISIRVTIPADSSFNWKTLKAKARSIKQAKQIVKEFFEKNPQYVRE